MKRNKKGFTLAELLIVVAIIAVLTAIAIPIFTTQLEKSRDATDQANIRSAYAELSAALITNTDSTGVTTDLAKGSFTWTYDDTAKTYTAGYEVKGTNDSWDNLGTGASFTIGKLSVDAADGASKIVFTVNDNNQITSIELN